MKRRPLTRKQERFIDNYLTLQSGKKAAIMAGYSQKTAAKKATELLANPIINAYLEEKKKEIAERNKITQDYFILHCRRIVEAKDSKYSEQTAALGLLAKITGHIKESFGDNKQLVVFQKIEKDKSE